MQRLPQTAAVIAVLLALPSVGVAQMQRMEVPKLVPLRLLITMDGDVEKSQLCNCGVDGPRWLQQAQPTAR